MTNKYRTIYPLSDTEALTIYETYSGLCLNETCLNKDGTQFKTIKWSFPWSFCCLCKFSLVRSTLSRNFNLLIFKPLILTNVFVHPKVLLLLSQESISEFSVLQERTTMFPSNTVMSSMTGSQSFIFRESHVR